MIIGPSQKPPCVWQAASSSSALTNYLKYWRNADEKDMDNTVFIGYPIWWGEAAWPVNNFIKSNDFTGKTVFPFCTSSTSDLGDSGELLAEMAGTGQWQEGERFPEQADESEIREWVQGLDLE